MYSGEFDATAIGGSAGLGYKLQLGDGFFIDPLGQLAYVSTVIDDGKLGAASVGFDDGESLRGQIGARAGVETHFGDVTVEPYVEAHLVREFLGANQASVFGYPTAENGIENWALAGGGVQFTGANAVAFVNLQALIGEDVEGLAGQGGVRWSF